jgi:hypothetical protein
MGHQHVFIVKIEGIGIVITVLAVTEFEFAWLSSNLIAILNGFQSLQANLKLLP